MRPTTRTAAVLAAALAALALATAPVAAQEPSPTEGATAEPATDAASEEVDRPGPTTSPQEVSTTAGAGTGDEPGGSGGDEGDVAEDVDEGQVQHGVEKRPLPVDLEDPQDLFGIVLLGLVGVAVGLGGLNALKQLRGERPQATGRWRPR